jgi:hypothetical protein
VNEGASGEHVAKIQAALKFLEGASIEIPRDQEQALRSINGRRGARLQTETQDYKSRVSDAGRQHCRKNDHRGP